MNVLLVNANRCTQPFPVFPLGACLIAQTVERLGHRVDFVDLMFEPNPVRRIENTVRETRPDLVGLSLRNIDNNDIQNPSVFFENAAQAVRAIRRIAPVPIVLGGAALGVMPEALLRHTKATWAVPAEGEAVMEKILETMSRGGDPGDLPGVLSFGGGRLRRNGPALARPLSDCTADFRRWVDVRRYLRQMATAPVQTKRGCPFDCVYCTYNLAEGRSYRLHDPAQVTEAVRRLAAQGLRNIEFVDNVFNSPPSHALAVCDALAHAKLPVRLQSLELNPRFVDAPLLKTMAAAGFVGIGITVESASDTVLAGLGKGFTADDVHRTAEIVRTQRLPCMWIFMFGGPGETPQTVRQTLEFARTAIRPSDCAFFTTGVRIYPGTPLERIARKQGLLNVSARDMLRPVFYLSPEVELGWLTQELNAAATEHLNFLSGNAISLPLLQQVLRISYCLGLRPPLWKHLRRIRKTLRLLRFPY